MIQAGVNYHKPTWSVLAACEKGFGVPSLDIVSIPTHTTNF